MSVYLYYKMNLLEISEYVFREIYLYLAFTDETDAANKIWEMSKCFEATDPEVSTTLLGNSHMEFLHFRQH